MHKTQTNPTTTTIVEYDYLPICPLFSRIVDLLVGTAICLRKTKIPTGTRVRPL
jgi:hypothetical protein